MLSLVCCGRIALLLIQNRVQKVLANAGAHVELLDFCRIETGEGIERDATDFASEVAAMANS